MPTRATFFAAFLLSMAFSGVVRAADAPPDIEKDPEFRFALGLSQQDYCDYGEEVFRKLKADPRYTRAQKARILEESASNYMRWAGQEQYAKGQFERISLAAADFKQFGSLGPTEEPSKTEHGTRFAEALISLGRELSQVINFPRGDLDGKKAASLGDEVFTQAVDALKAGEKVYAATMREVEAKQKRTNLNDQDRAQYNSAMEARMEVANDLGWAYYEWSRIYEKSDKKCLELAKLAEDIFTGIRSNSDYRNRFVVLPATLGQGVCRMARGDYNGAVQSFSLVLDAEDPSPDVKEVQDRALFFKGRAEFLWSRFDAAEKSLTELIQKRRPKEPLKSQARLELAKSQTKRVRLLWENAKGANKDREAQEKHLEGLQSGQIKPPEPKDPKQKPPTVRQLIAETRAHISDLRAKADDLESMYEPLAAKALKEVVDLSRRGGWVAMEAAPLMPLLREVAGKEAQSALDRFAEAQQLEQNRKYPEAIALYRDTLQGAGKTGQDAEVRANCWVQLALTYNKLNEQAHKAQDAELHYQAGLCLDRFARLYPDDERARNAAWWSTILLGYGFVNSKQNPYVAKVYLDSQQHFVETFPDDPRGDKMAFRLGDLRRGLGDYEGAIRFYRLIPQSSPYYERSQYHVGDADWRVYLAAAQKLKPDQKEVPPEARKRLEDAQKTLVALIAWADEQPVPQDRPDIVAQRRIWTGEARVRLGEIYAYRLVGKPEQSLQVLQNMGQYEPYLLADKDRAATVWTAYMIRVDALGGLKRMDEAEKAAQELLQRQPKFAKNDLVCRSLGVRFANMARQEIEFVAAETQEQAAARQARAAQLVKRAAQWFMQVLEVKPDQAISDYDETARLLFGSKAYANCIDVCRKLAERFEKTATSREDRDVLRGARLLTARSCAKMEKWNLALDLLRALHKEAPNDLLVGTELAAALQATGSYAEAANHWAAISESILQGRSEWFKAKLALAQCLARDGKHAAAFGGGISVVVAWHQTQSGAYVDDFQKPLEELIQKDLGSQSASYWKQYQEALQTLKGPQKTGELDVF